MARVRAREDAEISLFPFLSILVCLIGALVLLIVIFTMVQSRMGDGRTEEEMDRAIKALELQRELEALERQIEELDEVDPEAATVARELEEERGFLLTLRRRMDEGEDAERPEETDAELQRELELLNLEQANLARDVPSLQEDIERLQQEAEARQVLADTPPGVVVQPGGTGLFQDFVPYFVETNAAGLVILEGAEPTTVPQGTIGVNEDYNDFLNRIAANREARLVFLVRRDGVNTWRRAAGWAEGQFELQTGKLPLPTDGTIDLSRFQR